MAEIWVKCILPAGRYIKAGRTFDAKWQCVDVTETELLLLKSVPTALSLSEKNPTNAQPAKSVPKFEAPPMLAEPEPEPEKKQRKKKGE